jgi:catalase (peroxidase I)
MVEATTFVVSFLEPLWQRMCDKISRADFWPMMGKIAAEAADPTRTLNMPMRFGRKDSTNCDAGINRLPDHQIGITEYQRVFADQMGLTVAEGIVLTGAHTVGHVHPEHSGFGIVATLAQLINAVHANGWDETSNIFDNQYFTSLIGEVITTTLYL